MLNIKLSVTHNKQKMARSGEEEIIVAQSSVFKNFLGLILTSIKL